MKNAKVTDVEDIIDELYENDGFYDRDEDPIEFKVNEDEMISLDGPEVTIPDLNISLRTGNMLIRSDDEDDYEPDFSLTLIYEIGGAPEKYLYYEQDGVLTTLHNYLNYLKKKPDKSLSEMDCTIDID